MMLILYCFFELTLSPFFNIATTFSLSFNLQLLCNGVSPAYPSSSIFICIKLSFDLLSEFDKFVNVFLKKTDLLFGSLDFDLLYLFFFFLPLVVSLGPRLPSDIFVKYCFLLYSLQ
eukprot:TRINITY_DN8158_c0_g1_i1.p1 TRINITY_DN8158_c0_g1~~TRINITY_DN8158_c0_g1_i1.p1  ORF type:complete len:116 (+),score=5.29 TRINITY_DN8158_c0_g1_i1:361-708(+)